MGFGILAALIPIFAAIIFIIVIGVFVMTAVKGVSQWKKNNGSPVLTVPARVAAKRAKVKSNMQTRAGDNFPIQVSKRTFYYVTFEVEGGGRMEFQLDSQEYGLLAEGDRGALTCQGSRYKGFLREADISFSSSVGPNGAAASQKPAAPQNSGAPQPPAPGRRSQIHTDDSPRHGKSDLPAVEFFYSSGSSDEERREH